MLRFLLACRFVFLLCTGKVKSNYNGYLGYWVVAVSYPKPGRHVLDLLFVPLFLRTFRFSKVKKRNNRGCGAAEVRLVHVRRVLCSAIVMFSLLLRPFDASLFCGSNHCWAVMI
jgi:hypothetical protein